MKRHYTYKLTHPDTNEFYIGVRSCECEPSKDPYKGSMQSWKLSKEEKSKLDKHIYMEFETREDAEEWEALAIETCIKDPLNRNGFVPGIGFSTAGLPSSMKGRSHSIETRTKMSESAKLRNLDPNYIKKLSDSHKGIPKSDEHKLALKEQRKGRKLSESHKANISKSGKGVTGRKKGTPNPKYKCEKCNREIGGFGNFTTHKNKCSFNEL